MIKKEWQANILLFITSGIWGFAFIAQRLVTGHVGAYSFNAIRFFIGALSMIPILLLFRKKQLQGADAVPLRKTLLPGMLLGAVLFAGATLQQIGIYSTTAGKAGFITDLYIVLVPLAEIFMGRKHPKTIWICVVMAAVGLYLLSVTERFTISTGDLFELAGSFFWTAHIILVDRFSKKWNPVRLSFVQYVVCSFLSLLVALPTETLTVQGFSQSLLPSIYCGVLSVGVAYTLQITGQRYSKPAHASIILSMESLFACVAGILFLHEHLNPRGAFGCALMIGAMLLTQLQGRRKQAAAKVQPTGDSN